MAQRVEMFTATMHTHFLPIVLGGILEDVHRGGGREPSWLSGSGMREKGKRSWRGRSSQGGYRDRTTEVEMAEREAKYRKRWL